MVKLVWQAHHPRCFVGLILIEIASSVLPLGMSWLTKILFDLLALGLQGQASSWQSLTRLLVLQIGLITFSKLLWPLSSYLNNELNRNLSINVLITIIKKINRLAGLAPFEDPSTRDTLQMGAQGGQMGPSQALGTLFSLLHNTITLVSFLGVLAAFNPWMSGLVALVALPQLATQIKWGRQRFILTEENAPRQRRADYYSALFSVPYFAKELRLFDLGEYFLKCYRKLAETVNQTQRIQQQRELYWQFGLDLFSNLISNTAFILVVVQAFQGHLTLGDVTFYTSAVSSVQGALANTVSALANINESALFYSRYTDLLALPQPIYIHPAARPTFPLTSALKLCGVSFRYSPEHPWVLRDVSLTIPAGSCFALVGLNGAGKTTLVKLLTRMYDPTEGIISWDGVDIREFDPADLRRHITAIFQDFVRFDFSALENIALGDVTKLDNGNRQVTEKAVRRAAQKAGICVTLEGLPKGYDTVLSRWLAEDGQGVDLSGGEWQKIALARSFMRDADLLILDEPTATLDAQAEFELYNQFTDLVRGRTSLIISHRFSTARLANVIAVLENGHITEMGSHDELLSISGTYAKLFNMQAEQYR